MRCEEYESSLIAYVLGELPSSEASDCQAHIDGCPQCRRAYEGYLSLTQAIKAQPEPGPTARESELLSMALDAVTPARSRRGIAQRGFGLGGALKACLAGCAIVAVGLTTWAISSHHPDKHAQAARPRSPVASSAGREMKPVKIKPSSAPAPVDIARKPESKPESPAVLRRVCKRSQGERVNSTMMRQRHRAYVAVGPKVNAPEPQQPESARIPSDVAYQAGQLVGRGLNIVAETASPETCMKLSTRVKGMILPTTVKTKGESNEKSNSTSPGDRVNGGADQFGTMCIEASGETSGASGSSA